jgi:hypothetical protein
LKARRSPLEERRDAFVRVVRLQDGGEVGQQLLGRGALGFGQRQSRRGERRVHPERRLRGDDLGERERAMDVLTVGHDLLHHAHAEGLFRAELVAGEQPPHRVAPAALARHSNGRSADGVDAPLDLDLPEPRALRRDAEVGREEQLDADREADARHCANDGLGAERAPEAHRVDGALGDGELPGRHHRRPLREIEPAGEVIAVSPEDRDAQLGVALELGVCAAQIFEHGEVERIPLGGAIEADGEDVTAFLEGDLAFAHRAGTVAG